MAVAQAELPPIPGISPDQVNWGEWVTTYDAARLAGCARQTILYWIDRGYVRTVRGPQAGRRAGTVWVSRRDVERRIAPEGAAAA